MSPYFSIILVIIIIFVFQLTIKLKIFFNVKKNRGKLQLKFIGIKIFDYDICFKYKCLKLTAKNGKSKYFPFELNKQTFENYANFQSLIFRKIYFKTISIYFNFGVENDAFLSAMVCGYVDVFSKIFYSIFNSKKSEVKLKLKVYPSFSTNVIKIGFKVKISLSIYDLLWSLLETLSNKHIKSKKQKEFQYAR